ncbi:MAG: hypothetical protein IKZ88_00910 [Neisseriaceae bacterium]|nr:hypothetical protein [Neisseriaceae bacterium]
MFCLVRQNELFFDNASIFLSGCLKLFCPFRVGKNAHPTTKPQASVGRRPTLRYS